MATKEEILESVYAAVDVVNGQLDEIHRVEKSPQTGLGGARGVLDSLALVSFIVAVENQIEMQFHRTVSLTTDAILASDDGPLRTIDSLVTYLHSCLGE